MRNLDDHTGQTTCQISGFYVEESAQCCMYSVCVRNLSNRQLFSFVPFRNDHRISDAFNLNC